MVEPEQLEREYGLESAALGGYKKAAKDLDRWLMFCVGGTEEVFTQCSQNLFSKRPMMPCDQSPRPTRINAWNPALPLERLLRLQFETIQVTVSASGLPGVSPRKATPDNKHTVIRKLHIKFEVLFYSENATD